MELERATFTFNPSSLAAYTSYFISVQSMLSGLRACRSLFGKRTMATVGTLKRMNAQALSEKILEEKEATDPTFAVVDVRDDDHIGGHIKGSTHVPSSQLDAQMPTLVRKLADKDTVVFHCALSQQRGPSAALKYLREKDELLARLGAGQKGGEKKEQKVFVLDRGFVGWQEVFGTDERLTEGYVKDLWENY